MQFSVRLFIIFLKVHPFLLKSSHSADPFNLDHNLGTGVTRKMACYIQTALIRGCERFGFPRYDIPVAFVQRYFFDVYFLTDGYEAPNDRNCRVCGKIGHIAKECPHSKSNRRAEQKKEEEERKINQGEPGDLSRKPFNAGPSRPRAASAPSKQEQNKSPENRTPMPVTQPTKVPPPQEPDVTTLTKSQLDSQFVAAELTEGQMGDSMDENSIRIPTSEASQTLSPVHNLETSLADGNAVTGRQGEVRIDSNETHTRATTPIASSPIIVPETGDNPTALHSSRPSSGGNQINMAASTIPASSPASLAHAQSTSPTSNHSQNINPPPGFSIPDGTRQAPHPSSPQIIAGNMSPIAGRFQGQPITLNTPPPHHPAMFTGHFVGSPEMWLRQQAMMTLDHHFLPLRPLVPYPLTPESQAQAQFQRPREPSDNIPIQHTGSPVHGQHFSKHTHPMIPQSPLNISRNLMWPIGGINPPTYAGGPPFQGQLPPHNVSSTGMQRPAMGSPQQIFHPQLSHHGNSPGIIAATVGSRPNMNRGNPHVVTGSPQQMSQQFQFQHSPNIPPTPGSPPRHTPLHQQGPMQHDLGTHMVSSPYWPYWFYY